MKIDSLIEQLRLRFESVNMDNAKRVAEELVAHLCDCKPLEIYIRPLSPEKVCTLEQKIRPLADRLEQGEPLQYVVGHVDFWDYQFKSDHRALIPRPETELLVEEVLSSPVWNHKPATIVDVGTGSGCIVCTLAAQRPDAHFKAVDVSEQALELAQENAASLHLKDRILWLKNSLLDRFAPASADGIVANLPYISTEAWQGLHPSVRNFEPQSALDSGPSGMELIEELAIQARYVLVPKGMLFLEFGFDQGEAVRYCLEKAGYQQIQIKQDLAGLDRMAIATNP